MMCMESLTLNMCAHSLAAVPAANTGSVPTMTQYHGRRVA